MIKFTYIPNFTCPFQLFVTIRNGNIKQTFVLPPSCCLSFCKHGTIKTFSLFPTTYYHSQFQYLQVSIAHTPTTFACLPCFYH